MTEPHRMDAPDPITASEIEMCQRCVGLAARRFKRDLRVLTFNELRGVHYILNHRGSENLRRESVGVATP